MRNNCEILDLKLFLALFDLRSFAQASEVLALSQSSLTRRLQALEASLGAALFERTTRRVAPTRSARELEPGIRRLVREFEDALFSLGGAGGTPSGELTIAAIPTTASAFLPRILRDFAARYPQFHFRIRDLAPKEGLECVLRGEAELGINSLGASAAELRFTPLLEDDFVAICRRDHPLASARQVSWSSLAGYPLIVSQKSDNRVLIDQALARSELRLNWSYQVGHLATSFGLVEAGAGISIVPRLCRPAESHPTIAVVTVRNPVVTRTIGIVERRGRQLSRAAAALRDFIVEAAAAHSTPTRKRHAIASL